MGDFLASITAALSLVIAGGCGGKVLSSSGAGSGTGQAGSFGSGAGGTVNSGGSPVGAAGDFLTGTGGVEVGAGGGFIGVGGGPIGAGGGFAGASGIGGGRVDACGNPVIILTPDSPTICNFESGPEILDVMPAGNWFAYNDGTPGSFQDPPPDAIMTATPLVPPRGISLQGLHTYGKGFGQPTAVAYGGGIGFSFTGPGMAVDSNGYPGISFFAKGSGNIKVAVLTTHVVPEFCECPGATCYDAHETLVSLSQDWQHFVVRWEQLHQEGWGYQVAFDPREIRGVNFASNGPVDWDFWIDDISFYEPVLQ